MNISENHASQYLQLCPADTPLDLCGVIHMIILKWTCWEGKLAAGYKSGVTQHKRACWHNKIGEICLWDHFIFTTLRKGHMQTVHYFYFKLLYILLWNKNPHDLSESLQQDLECHYKPLTITMTPRLTLAYLNISKLITGYNEFPTSLKYSKDCDDNSSDRGGEATVNINNPQIVILRKTINPYLEEHNV